MLEAETAQISNLSFACLVAGASCKGQKDGDVSFLQTPKSHDGASASLQESLIPTDSSLDSRAGGSSHWSSHAYVLLRHEQNPALSFSYFLK